jgi:hypothetical protein
MNTPNRYKRPLVLILSQCTKNVYKRKYVESKFETTKLCAVPVSSANVRQMDPK